MGKKLRDEDLVLNIIVNGDQGKKEINELDRSIIDARTEVSKLEAAQKKLEKQGKADSAQYAANKAAMDRYNASIKMAQERIGTLRAQMSLESMSISDLQRELKRLTKIRNAATPETAQWRNYNHELQRVTNRLNELKKKASETGTALQKMGGDPSSQEMGGLAKLGKWVKGGAIGAGIGIVLSKIVPMLNRARAAFAEYDDKLSDVMKTTELTKDETESLSTRLKRINTRTPQLELLDLARVAGKVELKFAEDVEGFVRGADKINVALSEDLGGNAEDALIAIGKLVDIFDLKKKYGIEDSMIRVGSTVNDLGAKFTASEEYVVDFTNRMAGVAPQFHVSIENTMGLGATLDKFGQQCETAATTMSQVFAGMSKKTDAYARIARMSVKDFTDLLNRDANAALIAFLRGLKNSEGGAIGMTRNLASLKMEGSRATQILGVLAAKVDTLEEVQRVANQAFADGTSVINEFNLKNNNAQAQYEKSIKVIKNWSVELGRSLTPAYYGVTNAIAKLASTSQRQLEDEVAQYKVSKAEIIEKQRTVNSLAGTYNELYKKSALTKDEHDLLNKSIVKIGEIYPAAITKTNEYGEAIEINIDALNRAVEAEKKLNDIREKRTASKVYKQLKNQNKELSAALRQMQNAADDLRAMDYGESRNFSYAGGAIAESDQEARERLNKMYRDAKEKVRDLNADMKQNVKFLWDMNEKYTDISDASGKTIKQVVEIGDPQKQAEVKKKTTATPPPGDDDKSQWSLDKDKAFVTEKLALNQKLRDGEIATDEEYSRQVLALEIKTLEERIALNVDKDKHLSQLKSELADKRLQQTRSEQARYEKLIAAGSEAGGSNDPQRLMDQERANLEKKLRDLGLFSKKREDMTDVELKAITNLERNYQQKIQSIYMDGIVRRFNDEKSALDRRHNELKIAHNEEIESLTTLDAKKERLSSVLSAGELNRIRTDKQATKALKNYYSDEEKKELKGHLEQMLAFYTDYLDEISKQGLTGIGKIDAETQKQFLAIIDDLEKQLAELGGIGGDKTTGKSGRISDKVDILGFSEDDWQTFFNNIKEGKAGIDDWKLALDAIGNAFGQISNVMTAAENRELKQYEKTAKKKKQKLDAELKAKKISQEQYSNSIQLLDDETERKREEVDRKQAIRQKEMAIFQALTNTAVGITAALTSIPPNIPLSIIVGTLGAIQTAAIAATPLPGAEEGGWLVERQQDGRQFRAKNDPARRGYVSDPRVIVAENGTEYVVPSEGYENPTVRPVLDIIEQARRTGRLRSINLPAVLGAYSVPGRSAGGYADPSFSAPDPKNDAGWSPSANTLDPALVRQLTAALDKLNRRIEKPLEVNNYAGGRQGIKRALDKYDRIRDNASL